MIAELPSSELESATSATVEKESAEQPRTWKSSNGKFSVVATLLGVDQGKVRLKTDNKEIAVPLNSLSEEDQEYLKSSSK